MREVHLIEFLTGDPAHFGDLSVERFELAGDNACRVRGHDVVCDVAVRIGDAEVRASENTENTSDFDVETGLFMRFADRGSAGTDRRASARWADDP